MKIFVNFLSLTGFFIILYALILYYFPPKYLSIWYGINTSTTKKNKMNWYRGQKLFSFIILGIGIIFVVLGATAVIPKQHEFTFMLFLFAIWNLSKFIINHFIEKQYRKLLSKSNG